MMECKFGFLIFIDDDGLLCCIRCFHIVSVYVTDDEKIVIEDNNGGLHFVHHKEALPISKVLFLIAGGCNDN